MKNRDNKNFSAQSYYHIYTRGNAKEDIFLDDQDKEFFLQRLEEYLPPLPEGRPLGEYVAEAHTPYIRKALPPGMYDLLCYCLMSNHIHLLIRQNTELSLSKLMGKLLTSYSIYFNRKYERVGHVFQDRIKAVLVETDSQLMWVSSYIHDNPLAAGLVDDLNDYEWSSYLDYMGLRKGVLCRKDILLGMFPTPESYRIFVRDTGKVIKLRKDLGHLLLD